MNQYNVDYQKVWEAMNDLEMVTSKICSAREIVDAVTEAIQRHEYDKAETLSAAAYEFLGYYLEEFDKRFKDAWSVTISAGRKLDGYTNKETDYYQYVMPSTTQRDIDKYTDEELDAMCAKAELDSQQTTCNSGDTSEYCENSWNSFWEGNYYSEDYSGSTVSSVDKVVKWQLPVNVDGLTGDCYVNFPEDLLEAANLKEGDTVEWVDNGDGSYYLKKVTKPLTMDEC